METAESTALTPARLPRWAGPIAARWGTGSGTVALLPPLAAKFQPNARFHRNRGQLYSSFKPLLPMDFTTARPEDLLIDAARRGDLAALQALLASGLDLNTVNPKGFTPLILAAYDDDLAATRFLLEAGADPNAPDASGNTALMGVSFKGYADIARLLIDHMADFNLQNSNGGTALMFATLFGRNALVRLLLDAGADATIPDGRGLTALQLAGQRGNSEAWAMLGGAREL